MENPVCKSNQIGDESTDSSNSETGQKTTNLCVKGVLKTDSTDMPVNSALNREVQNGAKMVGYCAALLISDVCKQITSYGMKYYNDGKYPLPQTQIVAFAELMKFIVFLLLTAFSENGWRFFKISFPYAIPSLVYVLNNNIFYFALHYTTPPIWNILIQLRVILTALTYQLFFRRSVTTFQWLAVVVLITGIALSNINEALVPADSNSSYSHLFIAVCLAVFGSVTSVIGSVVMEFLFKNDNRLFVDKQTQLYLFSSIAAWAVYIIQRSLDSENKLLSLDSISDRPSVVQLLLISDLILACVAGFAVAIVVKKFDNIVKLYSQALSNFFTAIMCSLLFHDRFHLSFLFVFSLFIVFVAIVMYELKHCPTLRHFVPLRILDFLG